MAWRFLSVLAVVLLLAAASSAADEVLIPRPETPALTFGEGYTQLFGDSNLRLHGDGKRVHISLDERTGSGFASQGAYLHGFFSASIKLPSDYAAGVVVAFYMSNGDVYEKTHDELDFRVPGERQGQGVEGADQRVRRRQHGGGSGGEVRPLVRPHGGLPPLRHPLDQSHHPVLHRRDADQGGGPERADGVAVPVQAHVALRHHLGRLQLGHLGRPIQGGLQVRALRRPVHRPPAPAGPRPPQQRREQRDDVVGAAGGDGEGPGEAHDVRVLLRPRAVPGAAARVQGGRGGGVVPAVGRPAQQARQAPPACRRSGLRALMIMI